MARYRIQRGGLVSLPTVPITNCDNCGACCRHLGTPPGYAAFYPWDGDIPEEYKQTEDYARWLALPPEVERELRDYYDGVRSGRLFDRTDDFASMSRIREAVAAGRLFLVPCPDLAGAVRVEIPCLWYDPESKRCKHYEHRPQVCREAIQPGDAACRAARQRHRIPLPVAESRQ